jgi:hypothetical protein
MALKLKACDICGAVTSKDDEGFHLRRHAELERSLAAVERVRALCNERALECQTYEHFTLSAGDVLRALDMS